MFRVFLEDVQRATHTKQRASCIAAIKYWAAHNDIGLDLAATGYWHNLLSEQ